MTNVIPLRQDFSIVVRETQEVERFLRRTLKLVNDLQITEEEAVNRVVGEFGEDYRDTITTILDETKPKTPN